MCAAPRQKGRAKKVQHVVGLNPGLNFNPAPLFYIQILPWTQKVGSKRVSAQTSRDEVRVGVLDLHQLRPRQG